MALGKGRRVASPQRSAVTESPYGKGSGVAPGPAAFVCPQTRVIGGTFEFSFALPRAANRGNPNGRKNKGPTVKEIPEEQGEHEGLKQVQPEAREASRRTERDRRERLKASGMCRDCREPAIPNQTRCEACAEKHRAARRIYDAGVLRGYPSVLACKVVPVGVTSLGSRSARWCRVLPVQ